MVLVGIYAFCQQNLVTVLNAPNGVVDNLYNNVELKLNPKILHGIGNDNSHCKALRL